MDIEFGDFGSRSKAMQFSGLECIGASFARPAAHSKAPGVNFVAQWRCYVRQHLAPVAAVCLCLTALAASAEGEALIDFVASGSGEIEATCSLDADDTRTEKISGEVPLTHRFNAAKARCDVRATGPVSVVLSDGEGRQSSVSLPGGHFVVSLQ